MQRIKIPALFALVSIVTFAAAAKAQWKCVEGKIVSRWAKDVSPANALPEYPRPQMVRKDWQNLNGLWQYAEAAADESAPVGKNLDRKILVPFPIESSLSGVGKHVERLWYRRTFTVPAGWKGKRILLHFGAVDWESQVLVNGRDMGTHRGGYDAFSYDITEALKQGDNELIVRVFDPTNKGGQPRGKQVLKPGGIFYTPTTGIWQTVWLEPVAPLSIESLAITPDIDAGCVRVKIRSQGVAVVDEAIGVEAVVLDGEKQIATGHGVPSAEITLPIKNPHLWSPDDPFLYGLKVTLAGDTVTSYFGMRKISIAKDPKGVTRMMLNNKFIFQIGFLDQGFWPDGIYTAPTDAALRYDIEATKKLGFNMARKHVKIEPARWYYWADKLGLLVWQDMPGGDTTRDRKQFGRELSAMVNGLRNHPSIVMWVVFNEGWGQARKDPADTKAHVDLVRKLDPSRLINAASGWVDHKCGDIVDVHKYPGPGAPKPEENRASVLGEFGGLGLQIKDHLWVIGRHWGYRNMTSREHLTARYVELLRGVYQLKDEAGLSAAVYTQTTDCEGEVNGLMTYDRAVIKPDIAKTAAANRGKFPPKPKLVPVAPTSEGAGIEWKYTTEKPADGWFKPDFDDSSWKAGKGGFGTAGTPGAVVGTKWNSPDIYLRRTFELTNAQFNDLQLRLHHDEDAEVYINGVQAASCGKFVSEYGQVAISKRAMATLKKGVNTLAVHCKQTTGGQYIDAGLVDVVPAEVPAK